MNNLTSKKFRITPMQVLVVGFASVILIGAVLLDLPIASKNGMHAGFINALFTATSAVCVTGLVVVDTLTQWTVFGQVVIAFLIQIGGLGIMTISTLFALIIGRKITLRERLIIQEALNLEDLQGLVRLTKNIIITTIVIELIGAFMYSLVFVPDFGWRRGIYMGMFHAVSAFCNAGFDIIGGFRSFTPYVNNAIININTMLLIIIGGLGFAVWHDIYMVVKHRDFSKLSLHSKIVLSMTGLLIVTGAVFIFTMEINNPGTLKNLPISGKMLAPFFHSVTPRTAGFNTLDMALLSEPTKLVTIFLMFIGGSPGSTAGGIKTTTAGILILTVIAVIIGKDDVEVFERRLSKNLVYKALSVTLISLLLVMTVTIILSITEHADLLTLLFESTSAFATVGLSLNFTPTLSAVGKIIISLTMFAGRVGPLTLVLAFSQTAIKYNSKIKYPEDRVMVG